MLNFFLLNIEGEYFILNYQQVTFIAVKTCFTYNARETVDSTKYGLWEKRSVYYSWGYYIQTSWYQIVKVEFNTKSMLYWVGIFLRYFIFLKKKIISIIKDPQRLTGRVGKYFKLDYVNRLISREATNNPTWSAKDAQKFQNYWGTKYLYSSQFVGIVKSMATEMLLA